MLCSHEAAIAQELLKTGLLLFILNALPLKLLEQWLNRESQGKLTRV